MSEATGSIRGWIGARSRLRRSTRRVAPTVEVVESRVLLSDLGPVQLRFGGALLARPVSRISGESTSAFAFLRGVGPAQQDSATPGVLANRFGGFAPSNGVAGRGLPNGPLPFFQRFASTAPTVPSTPRPLAGSSSPFLLRFVNAANRPNPVMPSTPTPAPIPSLPGPGPVGAAGVTRDIVYRQDGGRSVRLDVYRPAGSPPAEGWPVVLAIHGGGWSDGSKNQFGPQASVLTGSGYLVVAVDYALAVPGSPSWPDALEDLQEAVRWIRTNAGELSADPNAIVAFGESAGGHLATLLGVYPDAPVVVDGLPPDPQASTPPGQVSSRVQGVINLYGPGDLRTQVSQRPATIARIGPFLGGSPEQVPGRFVAASPVSHIDPSDPPVLILQGTADVLVPAQQAVQLGSALDAAGVQNRVVILPGAPHGFGLGGPNVLPTVLEFLGSVT